MLDFGLRRPGARLAQGASRPRGLFRLFGAGASRCCPRVLWDRARRPLSPGIGRYLTASSGGNKQGRTLVLLFRSPPRAPVARKAGGKPTSGPGVSEKLSFTHSFLLLPVIHRRRVEHQGHEKGNASAVAGTR